MTSAIVIITPESSHAAPRHSEAESFCSAVGLAVLPFPKFVSYIDRHGEMQLAVAPLTFIQLLRPAVTS